VLQPLAGWDNFYVIIGSSAAALTGLMFVVVALSAEQASANPEGLKAFATPTIVHFCAVLLFAAFVSVPRHTIGSLRLCLLLAGLAGLAYATVVLLRTRRVASYTPVLSDWIWHVCLPFLAYAGVFAAAFVLGRRAEAAMILVAGSALLLLFIGIHNAWDAAVWMTINRKAKP